MIWFPKARLEGEMVAIGAVGAVPVPESATVCGEPEALSVNVKVPLRAPVVVGVNVTLTMQLEVAANVLPHPFAEIAKSPLIVTEAILRVAVPVF